MVRGACARSESATAMLRAVESQPAVSRSDAALARSRLTEAEGQVKRAEAYCREVERKCEVIDVDDDAGPAPSARLVPSRGEGGQPRARKLPLPPRPRLSLPRAHASAAAAPRSQSPLAVARSVVLSWRQRH
ncbi:hypothetical protein ACHAWF_013975 [Thalassiosira exigua]